jgi:hypothetical protein
MEARPPMTECYSQSIQFSSHKRQKVLADFRGGAITSDAGLLLLREADRRLRLTEQLDSVIPDPRNQEMVVHSQLSMLRQRIFGIAAGNEDLIDHQSLRDDPLMKLVCDRKVKSDEPLASPPTLCRLENRALRPFLFKMSQVLVQTFIAQHPTPPKQIILDFDATDDPVHGNQVGRFFHGYYDSYCFLPLYVFCGQHLLVAYLRPSNIDPATHAWAILALLVKRLRQVWPQVKIIFRADSGFCRWRMLRWCERHGVHYIVGMARNSRLQALAQPLMQQAKIQFEKQKQQDDSQEAVAMPHHPQPARVLADLTYGAHTWDKERRVIAKAEYLPGLSAQDDPKENFRFVVSNLDGEAQSLYEQVYCQRGEAENRIKEQQLGLFADRTSCHDFEPNQFRVLLSAAAYVLVEYVRRVGLADTQLADAQTTTLRVKLFKIGARVVTSTRRIVLHLASSFPLAEIFLVAAKRLIPAASP